MTRDKYVDFQAHYLLAGLSQGLYSSEKNFCLYLCKNSGFTEIVKNICEGHASYISNIYSEGSWRVGKVYQEMMKKLKSTYEANVELPITWIKEETSG